VTAVSCFDVPGHTSDAIADDTFAFIALLIVLLLDPSSCLFAAIAAAAHRHESVEGEADDDHSREHDDVRDAATGWVRSDRHATSRRTVAIQPPAEIAAA
jgi:hypothetical protein